MSRLYKKGDIIRTYAEARNYLEQRGRQEGFHGSTIRFVSIEVRSWYNPMRLICGNIYYKIV